MIELNILQIIKSSLKVDAVAVARIDVHPDRLRLLVLPADSDTVEALYGERIWENYPDIILATGKPVALEQMSEPATQFQCPFMKAENFEAYLGVPLVLDGHVDGVLQVMKFKPCKWTAQELVRLQEFAEIVQSLLEAGPKNAPSKMRGQTKHLRLV